MFLILSPRATANLSFFFFFFKNIYNAISKMKIPAHMSVHFRGADNKDKQNVQHVRWLGVL